MFHKLFFWGENEYIHRLIADNGQELCFVSGEKDPYLSYADVNFDGINDVVILTQRGASNLDRKSVV